MENNDVKTENLTPEQPQILEPSVARNKNAAIIAVCVILVIMLSAAIYFKVSKNNKDDALTEQKEIGTKISKANLDFSKKDEKPFSELIIEETKPTVSNENPFDSAIKKKTEFVPKVFKGASVAIVTNQGSGDGSEEGSNKPVDFTDPKQYKYDERGNIVGLKSDDDLVDGESGYNIGAFSPRAAKKMPYDANLLLPKGTYIGCSLNTRLVSSIKGGVLCTISENVYSANGTTLLIEKGSKMSGFFESGQLKDGMERIFVVWNEIRTTQNITIPIASGASDALGGSGFEGYVDEHWFKRFSSSILLSVIDDAFNLIANGKRGESNKDYSENTRENTKHIADTALQKFINIEPTLYKNQGDIVGVYVNRDIDFSKVYTLKRISDE